MIYNKIKYNNSLNLLFPFFIFTVFIKIIPEKKLNKKQFNNKQKAIKKI